MVDDVESAIAFYTKHFGFDVLNDYSPAFADVQRGNLRLLLSGPTSSAARPMPDGRQPQPGGWNRIHFIVDDLEAEAARAARGRGDVPRRNRQGARWVADPARRPRGQSHRALPAALVRKETA
jgi:catechol 2,3-dioxygenase-like lactoylglutathione lyase family enzyme